MAQDKERLRIPMSQEEKKEYCKLIEVNGAVMLVVH